MIIGAWLALSAFALQPAAAPDPDWMVGTWVWVEDGATESPPSCDGPLTISYAADGTYAFVGERGDWRLDDDRLTEVARQVSADHVRPEAAAEIGDPWVARIEPLDDARFRKVYAAGARLIFHRCPPAPARR